jgi:hypothetical protein
MSVPCHEMLENTIWPGAHVVGAIWGKGMSDIRLPHGMYLGMCSLTGY